MHRPLPPPVAIGTRTAHGCAQPVRPRHVHLRGGRVLQLLAVGQHALAGQRGGDRGALQRLEVLPHVAQGLHDGRIDRIAGRLCLQPWRGEGQGQRAEHPRSAMHAYLR
jgi:hypothetical protein